jgi:hypothetical protein
MGEFNSEERTPFSDPAPTASSRFPPHEASARPADNRAVFHIIRLALIRSLLAELRISKAPPILGKRETKVSTWPNINPGEAP